MACILHVERSGFFQKIVRDILNSNGFTTVNSSSISQSLEILTSQNIDLLITSLELDDGKGQDLIRQAHAAGINRPTVVITGSESLELRQELFALGVADYLVKQDLNDARLVSFVRHLIDPDPLLNDMRTMQFVALDDSRLSLQVIQSIFEMHGIKNLDLFTSAQALLDSQKHYDMMIIDLVMPEINGEDVVRALRKKRPDSMIVVASSINHSKTISHVLDSGANDYITKPFDGQLFMSRLKSTVRSNLLLREVREKQSELERLARVDNLTGLLNHRAITEYLSESLERRQKDPSYTVALFLIDIDDFKLVNDTHGHQMGDEVLQIIARHLTSSFTEKAAIGRYGGEEFLTVFAGLDALTVRQQTSKALLELKKQGHGTLQLAVSFSGGLVFQSDETAKELFATADAALYHAKNNGKGQIIEASK